MKRQILFISITFMMIFTGFRVSAQLGINTDGRAPDNSAMLDVLSTTRGFLIPRLSREQILSIASPANGLLVFCSTNKKFYTYRTGNNGWRELAYGSSRISPCCYCGSAVTDQRDGQTYGTMLIGTQCWMTRNLNVGIPVDGNVPQQNNSIIEKYCYDDMEDNCDAFGGLYQWSEVMQYGTTPGSQGICPAGWHIPTDAEWATLVAYLGGESVAGGKMKYIDLWKSPNSGGTNSSGFSAYPGGTRNDSGFDKLTANTCFWSSTLFGDANRYVRELGYDTAVVKRYGLPGTNGASVRCVK